MITKEESSAIKTKLQDDVVNLFIALQRKWAAVYGATGVGKSNIGLKLTKYLFDKNAHRTDFTPRILIVVPTINLRDNNWKKEFEAWGLGYLWPNVRRECYKSIVNIVGEEFDFVILDEGHNLTPNNSKFLLYNIIHACLLLTGTKPPRRSIKNNIINDFGFVTLKEITLEKAEEIGAVAPFNVTVITMDLDDNVKYVPYGPSDNKRLITEREAYLRYTYAFYKSKQSFIAKKRKHLISNLASKKDMAARILTHVIPSDKKVLIFCGSKDHAIDLCPHRYYSKPVLNKKDKENPIAVKKHEHHLANYQGRTSLEAFDKGDILRLSCINALNEGENINGLSISFIVSMDGTVKNAMQRIGRSVRFEEGRIANVIILCARDTVDEEWTRKALSQLTPERIRWIPVEELRTGKQTINFNEKYQYGNQSSNQGSAENPQD